MSRIRFLLALLPLLVFAQNPTLTVEGKSNIYAAGRGVPFHGVLPPAVRFAAGAGKVVTFPSVSGQIACNGIAYEPLHGPEGTVNRCGGTGSNIASWAGISGVVHKTRQMFLVGVFLDEREPSDPAPATLDFSTADNFATLTPLLGQVFFIGDGRTSGGALQQFNVPANATRLYLGFADAVGFSGAPYAYNDNNGSLAVQVAGVTPFVPAAVATGTTMTVNGKSSIYWSGLDVNWPTEMPPGWKFTAAPGRTMTVRASGSVTCKTGISAPPEGTAACGARTDLEPYGAVSGIQHPSRSMFLVGVFLNDLKPRGWPPSKLNFTDDNFATLAPLIGQTFYIGTGAGKRFTVPHDATRVFLGYARSDQMTGNPGWYQQGGGSLTAAIDITAGSDTGVSPIVVDAKSNLYASGRAEAFDGYLPPMIRITPGAGKVMTVPRVTGQVRCCGGGFTTADGAPYATNLNAYRGLSGIQVKWRGYFLAGVFLDDNVPDGAPPPKLIFQEPFDFASASPVIGQVFLIGDGVTQAGVPHQFAIPPTATRLYLGMAMGRLFNGDPGYYWEASDAYTATISISGGTVPPPCSYSLSETARSVAAAASTATVSVTTAAGCNWTAVSNANWITVTAGASGSGNGTVSYSVAANTGAARTGTLTIGGVTLTVTQAAAAPACTYTFEPTSIGVWHLAFSGTVNVTTAAGCSWTAVSLAPWIRVTSGESGTGPGRVGYEVAANPNAATRDGYLRIGTADFLIKQAPLQAMPGQPPSIAAGGVVNAASFTAALAPGSLFSIFGTDLAPTTKQADKLPLPDTFEGVTVEVVDGTTTHRAPLFFVSPGQVNGQLPYALRGNTVQIRVRNGAGVSASAEVTIAERAPRLFPWETTNAIVVHSDYRLVTAQAPALPGEYLIVFLVGMGAVDPPVAPGTMAPASPLSRIVDPVSVRLGGQTAPVLFAGLAPYFVGLYQVNFQVPADARPGSAPLEIQVGSYSSQSDLALPCDQKWESPANASVGAEGGTITAAGLTITIPPNTMAAPAAISVSRAAGSAAADRSALYAIRGMPEAWQGPVTLTFELDADPPSGAMFAEVLAPAPSQARDLIQVSAQGRRVTLTLRPQVADGGSATRRAEPQQNRLLELFFVHLVFGYEFQLSEQRRFALIHRPWSLRPGEAAIILRAHEEAWLKLGSPTWGFSFAESLVFRGPDGGVSPVILEIAEEEEKTEGSGAFQFTSRRILEPFAFSGQPSLQIKGYQYVSSEPLAMSQNAVATAARNVFSVILYRLDPKPGPWWWFHSAASEAMFYLLASLQFDETLYEHLKYGVDHSEHFGDPRNWQTGEYSHSQHRFVHHILVRSEKAGFLGQFYAQARLLGGFSSSALSALGRFPLLKASTVNSSGIGEEWQAFVRTTARGVSYLAPGLYNSQGREQRWTKEFKPSEWNWSGSDVTRAVDLPDLSAVHLPVNLPARTAAQAFQVQLTCPDLNVVLDVYKKVPGKVEPILMLSMTAATTVPAGGFPLEPGETFDFWIYQTRTGSWQRTTNATIKLTGSDTRGPYNWLTLASPLTFTCPIPSLGRLTNRFFDNVTTKEPFVATYKTFDWSGDEFRYSATWNWLSGGQPYQRREIAVRGELLSNPSRLRPIGEWTYNITHLRPEMNGEYDLIGLTIGELPCSARALELDCLVNGAAFRQNPERYLKVDYRIYTREGSLLSTCQPDYNSVSPQAEEALRIRLRQ